MFPYTEKCIESEYDIQNNDLSYKINPKCQNTFNCLKTVGKPRKIETFKNDNFLFCILYKFHNSYFVVFVTSVIWGFLDFGVFFLFIYIHIYITRVGLLHV